MTSLMIEQFTCRQDNFGVILHDPLTGETASIDAPDGTLIAAELRQRNWRLTSLLITHHHADHVEGIAALTQAYAPEVFGPAAEAGKIQGLTSTVGQDDSFEFAGRTVKVISTPGHTAGHICYYIPDEELLFAGDTLFALGCGRLFEGSPQDMLGSLQRLAQLPDETRIYCGHEYTQSNGRFALTVDPDNDELVKRMEEINDLRSERLPTLPTTIGFEKRTNPFMRAADPSIRKHLGMENASDLEVFAELRRRKDSF
ncbi:hydroxyacylglutathione hydrolase [Hoeflea sp. YIM 152468]|uniref:hydroxyacylglutathione hydrolase n=1 Tax=Hoeflea sp. YIM 152468 TaxID=3031759 RepID=UPI0023DCE92B|nr:hydroxyacylglutathione hydrolase [Hoeflea sp. YIM 152468]MDF1608061.1 hydroxyacylglutathione hydrolase [Hoeflea sp. YIM 152468]